MNSYGSLLKAASLIGGAQGVTILLGIVRTKFAAILIGPIGIGLIGTYQTILNMVGSVTGLGIKQSAVRDLAAAVERGDQIAVGRVVLTLRRMAWLTGLIGALSMVALAFPLSSYTFQSTEYVLDIALLGPVILLANIQGAQMALIQGMRRIGELAQLNISAALVSTLVSVILYSWLGLRGIIPAILLSTLIQLIISWIVVQRIPVSTVQMSWKETFQAAGGMVRLGLAFMWIALMAAVLSYMTRALIAQQLGFLEVGIFAAAFSLSRMFVDFILSAMSADYYPRLAGISEDKSAMVQLVNEQTEIGLLLAVPGLLAVLFFAPWIISLFYSTEFLPATSLLQWFILGCLGRVISWPMGIVMLALAKARWFFLTETLFTLLHLSMIWLGLITIGLEGVAIAFFSLYVMYIAAVYGISSYLIGFNWSASTRRLLFMQTPIFVAAFLTGRMLTIWPATYIGVVITIVVGVLCLRGLVQRIGQEHKICQLVFRVPGLRWCCGV